MPSTDHGSSHSTRIRDNQRRSRAQRKEYLESLQRRVQEYERRGIEATIEVQQAAKMVARENVALRRLLARRGVSQEEIDGEIQAVILEGNNLNGKSRPDVQEEKARRVLAPALEKPALCCRVAMSAETTRPQAPCSTPSNPIAKIESPPEPSGYDSENTTSVETSCIDAATIISQMRGDGDAEYARSMLGCEGTGDCKVKNTTLFQVFDRI